MMMGARSPAFLLFFLASYGVAWVTIQRADNIVGLGSTFDAGDADALPQGNITMDDCTGGRPGGGDVLCVGHTKGPKCGLCEMGYVSSATTNGKTLGCELCSGTNTRARRTWVSAIIVCVLVAAGLLYRHRARVFAAVYDAYGRLNALVVMSKGSRGGLGDVVMNEGDGRSMLATIWNKRSPVS